MTPAEQMVADIAMWAREVERESGQKAHTLAVPGANRVMVQAALDEYGAAYGLKLRLVPPN